MRQRWRLSWIWAAAQLFLPARASSFPRSVSSNVIGGPVELKDMAKPADKVFDAAKKPGDKSATPPSADDVQALNTEEPDDRTDFPCSVAQERFWLLDRLDPGNSAYNVAVRWRLEGRIATDLLERSWFKIIERHEILRTVFLEVDGAPIQRVMPRVQFRLNEIDLSTLSAELQQTEGDRIGVIEARAPFDLSSGPLIRATLLRYSPTVSIILVTTHQVVSDGWSIGVMAREMGIIYDALRHDKSIPLEPLSIQYADYSLWQLEWLKVRGTEAETAYWTKQLAGVKPFKVLPDHPRPAMPTTNGAIASRVLPRELTNRAQALSAERGATLFATAFAALCATLARFTNEKEIVVGTQVSDRDQVELEPMIGQFVNSLILRNDLGGNPTFGVIVDRIRDTIAHALEQRHIPIERLLGMVKSEKSDANTPPISVNFIFQKTFIQNTVYTDFALIDMPSLPTGAIYDLNFFMVERPDGWRFSCQYNTDQFEAATANRLLGYVETLLKDAVANPTQRLSELRLSATDEARQLLVKLNDTRTLYPRDLTLAKWFEAQAFRAPDSIAVICGDRELRYGEIDASANRLAAYLRQQGVAPGARVGVCLLRSMELPISLLAVLKAGATFMMLDPSDPPLRRVDLIRASGITAIIGQKLQRESVADVPISLIDVETGLAFGGPPSAGAPIIRTESDAPACLVLAAGDQNGPRVVSISHRNLANLIYSVAKRPGVHDRDVVVASSPFTVDRATIELFLPLLTGARLVVALDREIANGRALLHLLQRTNATVLFGDAQLWNGLLDAGWIGFPALKMLCTAQELGLRLVEKLSAMSCELWSVYGHPEAGIWSSFRQIKSRQAIAELGEPVANTALYVLDSSRQVAPVGAIGQLHVGGDGITDTVRPETVAHESNSQLYPTGDMARLQAGGQIEFLGRADDRFTYRGHSVDPAEIERVLLRQTDVAEAAVVLLRDGSGAGALTAFVVPKNQPSADSAPLTLQLQEALAESLPEYLLPSAILFSTSLPRLASGTVDRRALLTERKRSKRSETQLRPSGEIEERLAAIWSSMLGIESLGANGNFFELGGHSLLAARMLTQVEREFGRRIKLATLFLAPTLQDFAKVLTQSDLREFDFRQVVRIQPHGSRRPLIVVNNTGIYYGLAKGLGPEQPVYSLQLFDPSVRDAALPTTLQEIAAGYVNLIRRVQPQGPYDLMGWCVAGALAFEIAQQLVDDKQTVSNLFLIDSWVPGYFRRQPKIRGLIASYSLRGQLILADWRRVRSSESPIRSFITQRTLFKRLKRVFLGSRGAPDSRVFDDQGTLETYDQWLLAYLQRLTVQFEPRPYHGKVTLLRSRLEPTGWFFQEDAGWSEFARSGVEVRFVDGNHFTMFQDPGSSQMAAHVAAELEKPHNS
jgi:non-ribosomal peptide synthetase component F/thioesterase domain-containing protein